MESRSRLLGAFFLSLGLALAALAIFLYANRSFDYRRIARLSGAIVNERGGGTGVVVAPGADGLTRVLTNGHICDMISVWPGTAEGQERLTEEQSLYRPVSAVFKRADGRKPAKALRIVRHSYVPDLCLVELSERSDGEYAEVSRRLPEWGAVYAAAGNPLLMAFTITRGEFWGLVDTPFPPRLWKPSQEAQAITLSILGSLCDLIDPAGGPGAEGDPKDFCAEARKQLSDLLAPVPYKSALYHIDILPGNSGSGVWDESGRLVGMAWGIATEGFGYAFAVNYGDVRAFLGSAPR